MTPEGRPVAIHHASETQSTPPLPKSPRHTLFSHISSCESVLSSTPALPLGFEEGRF